MNNDNIIRLMNENGAIREFGSIPDLWHIAQSLPDTEKAAVLEVWQLAHGLKAVIEKQGEAKLL